MEFHRHLVEREAESRSANAANARFRGLCPTRIVGVAATNRPQYAVARDGRFLINQPVKEAAATPITLLVNWRAEAKR